MRDLSNAGIRRSGGAVLAPLQIYEAVSGAEALNPTQMPDERTLIRVAR